MVPVSLAEAAGTNVVSTWAEALRRGGLVVFLLRWTEPMINLCVG
jgi:hypothetical protein